MVRIKRALISVSNKDGLDKLVRALADMKVEILSTGGTAKAIESYGVSCTRVEDYTGFPEMMDGRVKTLHPKVHGALLGVRDSKQHVAAAKAHGIEWIDMVVVNLYPFQQTIAKPNVNLETAIENIDIGGPAMLRSAAKNHKYVAVVCDPARYDEIIAEMKRRRGSLSDETRQDLALEAFAHTGQYDAAIAQYLAKQFAPAETAFPEYFAPWYQKVGDDLRYGENPHQQAAVYAQMNAAETGLARAKKLHGDKELSYNNYLDLTAALEAARDFDDPTAVIIKHQNPCGLSSADTMAEAFKRAWASDPLSAFGSVMGFNEIVDVDTALRIGNSNYLKQTIEPLYREGSGDMGSEIIGAMVEAIIAPGYEPEALAILKQKRNLRVMELSDFRPKGRERDFDLKRIPGGLVVQTQDLAAVTRKDLKVVTERKPSPDQLKSMLFADRVAKHVKSNGIVLVIGTNLVGCGAGQMSRVDSCLIAARKAGKRAMGSVLASDAMFPARDGLDAAADTGAVAIIQPGGSVKDEEVIKAANERGLVMVFSGMRHFWH